jgi:hypothetical protein
MRKTFPLHLPDKTDAQVMTALQLTLNKYVKRERRKALPEGARGWTLLCRLGTSPETAEPCDWKAMHAGIQAIALAEHPEVYVEILAAPSMKVLPSSAEEGVPAEDDSNAAE